MQSEGRGDGRRGTRGGGGGQGYRLFQSQSLRIGPCLISILREESQKPLLAWSSLCLERDPACCSVKAQKSQGEPAHPCTHFLPAGLGVFVVPLPVSESESWLLRSRSRLNVRGSIWAEREDGGWGLVSLFREHGEYKLENHLLGPSCLAVVFTKMGSVKLYIFFSPLEIAAQMQWFRKVYFWTDLQVPKSQGPCKYFSTKSEDLYVCLYTHLTSSHPAHPLMVKAVSLIRL